MDTKQRNSGIELLRIICIWGILCMHVGGAFGSSMNRITIVSLNLINSLFNICVTCFVLTAGYFGIKRRASRLFGLWCIVMFYSLAGAAVSFFRGSSDMVFFFKSLFPTVTAKYWYFTTYVILAVFAPYINRIPEVLPQKKFELLLLLLLLFFYIAPTFFYFEIIKDNGKGPVNMFIVYLIGRYIAIYKVKISSTLKTGLCFMGTVLSAFVLNVGASLLRRQTWAPFARDNSLFMLTGAILLFVMFLNISFTAKYVNALAKNVFAVYIGESIFRNILLSYLPVSDMDGKIWLIPCIAGIAVSLFILCTVVEFVRSVVCAPLESVLFKLVQKLRYRLQDKLQL